MWRCNPIIAFKDTKGRVQNKYKSRFYFYILTYINNYKCLGSSLLRVIESRTIQKYTANVYKYNMVKMYTEKKGGHCSFLWSMHWIFFFHFYWSSRIFTSKIVLNLYAQWPTIRLDMIKKKKKEDINLHLFYKAILHFKK